MALQQTTRLQARWLAAMLAALLACETAKPKPDEPEVKSLDIDGARGLSVHELKSKLATSDSSSWPWGKRHYFDAGSWQGDLRRVIRLYESEGYYNARVEGEVIPVAQDSLPSDPFQVDGATSSNSLGSQSPAEVKLKLRVEEGPPTRISRLAIGGLDALPSEHRLEALSDLTIKEGDVFKERPWESGKADIESKLRRLGYVEAVVRGRALVDLETNQADLQIASDTGKRYRFGDVSVSTNPDARTPISWIREQAESAMAKGSWVSAGALREAQARVSKIGVFGAVKLIPGDLDRAEATLPMTVDVREAPFHTVRFGAGLEIDPGRNETRLIGEYTDRDFLGGLRKFTLRGELGWVFVPNILTILQQGPVAQKSEPVYLVKADFEQPRALFKDVRLQTSLMSQRDAQQTYSFIGGGGRFGFVWQPHSTFSISPSYNLELDYLLSGQTSLGGNAPELFYGCPAGEVNCLIVLSYLEQAIIWDHRDEIAEPRTGFYLALTLQEGGDFLGGSFTYFRIVPEARYYHSFPRNKRFTLSARVRLGILRPVGSNTTSPIVARFFSGGDAMRGFNYRRLSPLLVVQENPSQTTPDGVAGPVGLQGVTVPTGGNGLFESTFEMRYNLVPSNFVLALFLDAGFVTTDDLLLGWSRQGANFFANNMQYAVGVGLRYRTPVGPIRFDIARRLNIGPPLPVSQQNPSFPLNPPPAEEGFFRLNSRLFRTFGGHNLPGSAGYPEGIWTFHLSIGEAF
jgi:translocation and assembly module TamA